MRMTRYRCGACFALLALLPTVLHAEIPLRRLPARADYQKLILESDNNFRQCEKLIMPRPQADNYSVLVVRSDLKPASTQATVSAMSFSTASFGSDGHIDNLLNGFIHEDIAAEDLADRQNADAYLRPIAARIMDKKHMPADATVVVVKGSGIGAATLIRQSREKQFIVEQESASHRFADNMKRLASREPSTHLSVFDFAPRSQAALDAMGMGDDPLSDWKVVSKDVESAVRKRSGGRNSVEPRTLEALQQRLADTSGGVVVIYGHSDGDSIFLDTDEGVHRLTTSEIREIGVANGGELPPILLLNCRTRAALAPAFLAAGSPLVMTSDRALPIVDIAKFVDRLSQRVYKGTDVIDAFYDVQRDFDLVGIRAIAALGLDRAHRTLLQP